MNTIVYLVKRMFSLAREPLFRYGHGASTIWSENGLQCVVISIAIKNGLSFYKKLLKLPATAPLICSINVTGGRNLHTCAVNKNFTLEDSGPRSQVSRSSTATFGSKRRLLPKTS